MNTTKFFLNKHQLSASFVSIQQIVDDFTSEMNKGLQSSDSSLRMIPTYIEADNEFLVETPVVAIDAGGTNFRTALVQFNKAGQLETTGLKNYRMPGIDGEVSKKEFFRIMSENVKEHASKAERIGFCFSYPTEIYPDKDGRLLQFCKEVEAPEVVGQLIGKNLLEALEMPKKQIVLLNDTVATLLAGKSASYGKTYDSFIGYILGTGTNTCYIDSNENVTKTANLDKSHNQIINIESGNFSKAPRTDIDIQFDNKTANPGNYSFEKMFAGGYFGGLCLEALKTAAKEEVFSVETAKNIQEISELSTEELNKFRHGDFANNTLKKAIVSESDLKNCNEIIDALIKRSAILVAANIAAVVLKTGKGKSKEKPILITVEGTTFYKLYNFQAQFEECLAEYLSGDKKRYYEFIEVKQSSLVGAALSALIN